MHWAPFPLNSLSLFAEQQNHPDPPHPSLSTCSCSFNPLPYTWTRAKQNERGCLNRWLEVFTSGRKGHPKQGGSTYWVCRNRRSSLPWFFWDGPICCCKIVDFDGGAQCHPSRRRDQASSVDSPLFRSISKASCCLLYGWGVHQKCKTRW